MANTPNEINVTVKLAPESRIAIAELIGFGLVGTVLDGALETLKELDPEMADQLDDILQQVMTRFHAAEEVLYRTVEFTL